MRNRRYYIETKKKDYLPFDGWITKLEMVAFGWVYKGYKSQGTGVYDVNINWESESVSVSERFNGWTEFKRVRPYTKSLFFKFLELCMSVTSWIRRKLILLLWVATALSLGLGLLELIATQQMNSTLGTGIVLLAFVYAPSLFLSLAGFLYRKIFRLDKKLKNSLEANGYSTTIR